MLTVCPKCTLTLAVTAADLRIGQGYVRCGRCATVFNALLALSDASTMELPGSAPPPFHDNRSATVTVSVGGGAPPGGPDNPSTPEPVSATLTSPPAPQPAPAPSPAPAAAATSAAEPAAEAADIQISPSLAAEPLDMLLEQTSAVAKPSLEAGPAGAPHAMRTAAADAVIGVETIEPAGGATPDQDEIEIEIEAEAQPAANAGVNTGASAGADVAIDSHGVARAGEAAAAVATTGIESRENRLEATGTVHTIVMQGSSVSQSEEFVDIDTIDSEIAAATRRALQAEARKSIASLDQDLGESGTHAAADPAAAAAAPEAVETRLTESGSVYVHDRNSLYAPRVPPPKPPPSLLLWGTYAALLVLILGAQVIHYWRNDLALRNDWIGQSLTRIYAVLALPLTPNWDLRGYDVRQLGAATNGSGDNAIRVRISLTNRAARAQPWPVLRLSLYNRYGKRVAARDLQPRDYLPREKAGDLMPVAQQIDSEVAVMDPGPDASSFELDVCVPAPHGLRCASDSPLRSPARS